MKFGQVLEHAVDAICAGRVRIGLRQEPIALGRRVLAPDLRVAQEKALFRRIALQLGQHMLRQTVHHRHVGETDTAVIGCIFA